MPSVPSQILKAAYQPQMPQDFPTHLVVNSPVSAFVFAANLLRSQAQISEPNALQGCWKYWLIIANDPACACAFYIHKNTFSNLKIPGK